MKRAAVYGSRTVNLLDQRFSHGLELLAAYERANKVVCTVMLYGMLPSALVSTISRRMSVVETHVSCHTVRVF